MKKLLFFCYLLLLCFNLFSQLYNFKNITSEKVKIYPYIYSINQDTNGLLWIGTGNGLYIYDGKNIYTKTLTFFGGDNFVTNIEFAFNNTPYIGLNNGSVLFKATEKFQLIKETFSFKSAIKQLKFYKNFLWVAIQNKGIYKIDKNNNIHEVVRIDFAQTFCFTFINDVLYIGTSEGLKVFKNGILSNVNAIPSTNITCLLYNPNLNIFIVGTEDEGLFELKKSKNKFYVNNKFICGKIKDAKFNRLNNLYIATLDSGIYVFNYMPAKGSYSLSSHINTNNGLPLNEIKCLFFDREDNLWIGTYGGGLLQYYESPFSFIPYNYLNKKDLNITALFYIDESIYAGTESGKIFEFKITYPFNSVLLPFKEIKDKKISSIFIDKNLNIWLGTDNDGIFVFNMKNNKLVKHFQFNDNLQNSVTSIDAFGNMVAIGTKNGLIIIDISKKYELKTFTSINGLPHNYINQVFCSVDNKIKISTPTNFHTIYNIHSQQFKLDKINIEGEPIKFSCFCYDNQNNLWLGTLGNGVIFKKDSLINIYNSENGLFSDYIYSIIADENSNIWTGHRQGLSQIKNNGEVKTFSKNINFYGDCNPLAICLDKYGTIWFGTTQGLLRYDAKKNILNSIPPKLIINNVFINDIEQSIKNYYELDPGKYKLQINFTGICLREPDSVKYQFILEGYDTKWSNLTTNNTAIFPRLDEGIYKFKIIAYNNDNVASEPFTPIVIKILPPIYKRWWFIVLVVILTLTIFYIILKIRERNHLRMERILKERLDQRTREVIKQKELLEIKNKDIMDSIKYAKRIQDSMLPSLKTLHQSFPNSFVMYMPRDIVSGDFYMIFNINNTKIIICADATGHGVPGAFMSLISMTLLKDIILNSKIYDPSKILDVLDKEISNIFSSEESDTQDGLDIAICAVNNERITISSAMRPVIFYHNNERIYIKGNRFSIGKSKYTITKTFNNSVFKYSKSDRIYLFSDGITDQFGLSNKKLKVSGLISWIDSTIHLPITQQYVEIYKNFIAWKSNNQQIDDILLIGIEF
ncbi:MAG: SpoIIE family protein phosphatase [Bacteroidales bacterium]|nr:SpoIIE family protein phosphatase [Bacteroidales bacterium]